MISQMADLLAQRSVPSGTGLGIEAFWFILCKEGSAWNSLVMDASYILDAYEQQIRSLYSQSGYSES